MTKLQEPHLTSNEDHHHGEAIAHYGGMGLVGGHSIQHNVDPSEVLAETAVEGLSKI
jgi:hypothetical protein